MEELKEKRDNIRQAMEYAVPQGAYSRAEDLLDIYYEDSIGLNVMYEFYSTLPEAKEDWIREILVVAREGGIFLLSAMTGNEKGYLYLVSREGIEFQGRLTDGFLSTELIDYFHYENEEAFAEACLRPDAMEAYQPLQVDDDICPACHALTGEIHELGCPVEVCPWCGGQLVHCDCRFEKMEVEAITSEKDLVRLEALLEERGRIAYSPEQRPSFADEGPGVVFD